MAIRNRAEIIVSKDLVLCVIGVVVCCRYAVKDPITFINRGSSQIHAASLEQGINKCAGGVESAIGGGALENKRRRTLDALHLERTVPVRGISNVIYKNRAIWQQVMSRGRCHRHSTRGRGYGP